MIGLEPTRLTAPDPKSGAAANYATCARLTGAKLRNVAHVCKHKTTKNRKYVKIPEMQARNRSHKKKITHPI